MNNPSDNQSWSDLSSTGGGHHPPAPVPPSHIHHHGGLISGEELSQSSMEASQPQQGSTTYHPGHRYDGGNDEYRLEEETVDSRIYNGVFEGPEKTLEVCFRRSQTDSEDEYIGTGPQPEGKMVGLRRLKRKDIDVICHRAHCTILSSVSNKYLDAYVLSESSLFVYPYRIIIKTCGTTTLLRCVSTVISIAKTQDLEVDWVGYSRKNFNFPTDQMFPHQSFDQELQYLASHRRLSERLQGNGYTLGPITSDHWFVFVADQTKRMASLDLDTDRVINVMMFDIDETVAKNFYYDQYDKTAGEGEETEEESTRRISSEMTKRTGIDALCPGSIVDPRAFSPCGYSMNAILFRSYSTMHVTPEEGSSYASFETNAKLPSYNSLINNVVRTFRPRRFVMTLMADEGGLREMKDNILTEVGEKSRIACKDGGGKTIRYKRQNVASITVEEDTCCMMGNWIIDDVSCPEQRRSRGMTMGW